MDTVDGAVSQSQPGNHVAPFSSHQWSYPGYHHPLLTPSATAATRDAANAAHGGSNNFGLMSGLLHSSSTGGAQSMYNLDSYNALMQLSSPPSLSQQPGMVPPPPPPPPMPQQQQQQITPAANQMATVQCVHCQTQLSYPTGTVLCSSSWGSGLFIL